MGVASPGRAPAPDRAARVRSETRNGAAVGAIPARRPRRLLHGGGADVEPAGAKTRSIGVGHAHLAQPASMAVVLRLPSAPM